MNWDQLDRLINALVDFKKYPTNNQAMRKNPDLVTNISRYAKMLNDRTDRLLNAQDAPIEFIEMLPGDTCKTFFMLGTYAHADWFGDFEIARVEDIKVHLTLDRPDPKCRFVYVSSFCCGS